MALLPGRLTPVLQEELDHLGSWMPFGPAAEMLRRMRGVTVSEATARRHAEGDGAAYVAVQEAEVTRLERETPEAPPADPGAYLLSADGTMVSLVHREWAEVKSMLVGVIAEPVMEQGEWVVHTGSLSYFSRLTDADTFTRLALVETHRRGLERAERVVAVTDGAEWEQGFIDYHRSDAVRVLDFPHAGEYVAAIGSAIWGADAVETRQWVSAQLTRLKHEGASAVLPALRLLVAEHADVPELAGHLAYLEKRETHMQYPVYQAAGWPIGSGAIESSHQQIVEMRLVGAGMHWARRHVNPMLGLRNAVCNDRWDEAWACIERYRLEQLQRQRQVRCDQRRAKEQTDAASAGVSPAHAEVRPAVAGTTASGSAAPATTRPAQQGPPATPRRPAPDHPWRKYPACTPRHRRRSQPVDAGK